MRFLLKCYGHSLQDRVPGGNSGEWQSWSSGFYLRAAFVWLVHWMSVSCWSSWGAVLKGNFSVSFTPKSSSSCSRNKSNVSGNGQETPKVHSYCKRNSSVDILFHWFHTIVNSHSGFMGLSFFSFWFYQLFYDFYNLLSVPRIQIHSIIIRSF